MASLTVLQGPDKGKTFETGAEPAILGRNSRELPLTDNTVSRRHARIFNDNSHWYIEDSDSANGTFLNGVRISEPKRLKRGDQIRIGSTLLVFTGEAVGERLPDSVAPREVIDLDVGGKALDSAILSSIPSNEDSVIIAAPETAEAVRSWRVILELIDVLRATMTTDELLGRVMDIVFEEIRVDRGFILLREEPGEDLVPHVVHYRNRPDPGQERITTSQTIINYVVENKESVLCSNAMADERFANAEPGGSIHRYALHSVVCVPIMTRDNLLGVIHIDSAASSYTYGTEQLRLMNAIGMISGMALESARLVRSLVGTERLAAAGEAVALVSHSIKNILQGLGGGQEMVNAALLKGEQNQIRAGWEIVDRNLAAIYALTMNMLAFSKEREPHLTPAQLNNIVEDAVHLVQHVADQRGVVLLTDLGEKMPAVPLDRDGVQQLVLNLVSNAVEAVEQGSGQVTVRTGFLAAEELVLLSVEDNGPGIPQDQVMKVFEPFHSTKGQGGTGLGLAVTKKVVEEHRGTIKVFTALGQGTRFEVRLPTAAHKWTSTEQAQETIRLDHQSRL